MDLAGFDKLPLMGILRGIDLSMIEPLIKTVLESGLRTIEVTMNTPQAEELIRKMSNISKEKLSIGAGTVLDEDSLSRAVDAGAGFIVTPVFDETVIKTAHKKNIPIFPGALTPSEAYKCWQYNAAMVKIFPASCFGPKYFKELKGPFADIKLMAVGGVKADNVRDFFSCGADAVAVGGSIFNLEAMRRNDYSQIAGDLSLMVKAVSEAVS